MDHCNLLFSEFFYFAVSIFKTLRNEEFKWSIDKKKCSFDADNFLLDNFRKLYPNDVRKRIPP